MPIYLYRCPNCGTEREVIQAYTAPAPVCDNTTPVGFDPQADCSGVAMERIPAVTNWAWGDGPKESNVSRAIRRVKARGL